MTWQLRNKKKPVFKLGTVLKSIWLFSSRLILPIISAFPILFLISKKDFSLVSNQATNQRLSNIFKRMVMSLLWLVMVLMTPQHWKKLKSVLQWVLELQLLNLPQEQSLYKIGRFLQAWEKSIKSFCSYYKLVKTWFLLMITSAQLLLL